MGTGARRGEWSRRLDAENAEGFDGPAEAAPLETAEGLDGDEGLGLRQGLAIGEYLPGIGVAAQPGDQVGDRADGADGGEALGDADSLAPCCAA